MVVGGIIVVNIVIFSETERGLVAGFRKLFAFNWGVAGFVAVAIVGFPVLEVFCIIVDSETA